MREYKKKESKVHLHHRTHGQTDRGWTKKTSLPQRRKKKSRIKRKGGGPYLSLSLSLCVCVFMARQEKLTWSRFVSASHHSRRLGGLYRLFQATILVYIASSIIIQQRYLKTENVINGTPHSQASSERLGTTLYMQN